MNISFPHEGFNAAVADGTVAKKIGQILEEVKPEAVYFTEQNGKRGAIMIVNISEPSKIPSLSEPWFLTFNADVKIQVVMGVEDLQKSGLESLGKKWH